MHFVKLTAVILLCAVASANTVLIGNPSLKLKLQIQKSRVRVIYEILAKECPNVLLEENILTSDVSDDDHLLSSQLEAEKRLYNTILNQLVKCRKAKFAMTTQKAKSVTSGTSTTISATSSPAAAKSTSTTSGKSTPTPHLKCQIQQGYLTMYAYLISYHNPSNSKATGVECDREDKSDCDLYFEICISSIDKRDCSLFYQKTNVVGEDMALVFSSDLGGLRNPIIIDLGDQDWTGVNILVTVWDKDENQPYDDQVDEFIYDFTDPPGSSQTIELTSIRPGPKSWLKLTLRNFCQR